MLIVDEGHQIKNPSCQSGRSLRRINARSRILLTGPEAELGRGQDEPRLCKSVAAGARCGKSHGQGRHFRTSSAICGL